MRKISSCADDYLYTAAQQLGLDLGRVLLVILPFAISLSLSALSKSQIIGEGPNAKTVLFD